MGVQNETGQELVGKGKGKGKGQGTDTMGKEWLMQHPELWVHKLFFDHSWYTQDYLAAVILKLETAAALKERLVKNQRDIGDALGQGFPNLAQHSQEISQLLIDHIVAADNVVQVAVSKQNLEQRTAALYAQGDAVAKGLAPVLNLPEQQLMTEWHTHNEDIIKLATLLMNRKFGQEYIQAIDLYQDHVILLADMIFQAANQSSSNSSSTSAGNSSSTGNSSATSTGNSSSTSNSTGSSTSPPSPM